MIVFEFTVTKKLLAVVGPFGCGALTDTSVSTETGILMRKDLETPPASFGWV